MNHPLSKKIQHAMQLDYYQNSGNNYISMVGFLEIIAVFCTDRSYDRNIETTARNISQPCMHVKVVEMDKSHVTQYLVLQVIKDLSL